MLLLNATYEPLTAISPRRAIVLMLRDRADVVHDAPDGPLIHSADRCLSVPTVIRLRTYVRVPYRAQVPMTRAALMHRDRHRCGYCGGKADTIDHVLPRSRGGADSWENLVACCLRCNNMKGDRTPQEMGWDLRWVPQPPRGSQWTVRGTERTEPSWEPYLSLAA